MIYFEIGIIVIFLLAIGYLFDLPHIIFPILKVIIFISFCVGIGYLFGLGFKLAFNY